MNKVRVFVTFAVLALLLYGTNVGPVKVFGDDDGSVPDLLCGPRIDAGNYSGFEGSPIPLSDSVVYRPTGVPLTYSWTIDREDLCTFDDPTLLTPT